MSRLGTNTGTERCISNTDSGSHHLKSPWLDTTRNPRGWTPILAAHLYPKFHKIHVLTHSLILPYYVYI